MKNLALLALFLSTWVTLIGAAELLWDLRTVDLGKYTGLLGGVRNELKGPTTCFQIAMIAQPPSPSQYIIIKFVVTTTNNIFIAMDKSNAYVVGYADTFNGKQRAFLLSDAPANAKDKAFPDAVKAGQVNVLGYGGSYLELERNAEISRKSLGLTRKILLSRATNIAGVATTDRNFRKNQAQFFLVTVQMVAEASRFKYIEGQLTAHLNDEFYTPNEKILTIVNQWGAISKAIAEANANGAFQRPLTLTDANGGTYTVNKVDDVRQDIALLIYIAKPCAKALSHVYAGLNV